MERKTADHWGTTVANKYILSEPAKFGFIKENNIWKEVQYVV